MGQLIQELKRRNVIRVAVAYAVAAWLLIEVTSTIFPILSLPAWSVTLVTVLLLIGLPLVLVFSWAYEITPEGIKKEKDVDRSESVTRETARKLDIAVIVLLVLAIGGIVADRSIPDATTPATDPTADSAVAATASDRSIAVLPFTNMSADPDNEYFSDGLSEELLNLLAKIPELKVAARTSAFSFKDTDTDAIEIASQLRVAHILEGSVRQSGDRLRITAQLIDASNGYRLWSNTWERTLTDVFDIQDEIAAAVVESLRVTLLDELPKSQRTDPEAYALLLKGRVPARRFTSVGFEEASRILMQAIAIDPDYAVAWGELALNQLSQVINKRVPLADGYSRAEVSALRALEIDPQNVSALVTLGGIELMWRWNVGPAGKWFRKAYAASPGDPNALNAIAIWSNRLGRPDIALGFFEEAVERDPLNVNLLANLATNYVDAGQVDSARLLLDEARRIDPESSRIPLEYSYLESHVGNFEKALSYSFELERPYYPVRACAFHKLGRISEAQAELEGIQNRQAVSASNVANVYACWNEIDKAFEWLERSYQQHDPTLMTLRANGDLQPLHDDPRWDALLEKLGLSDGHAKEYGLE